MEEVSQAVVDEPSKPISASRQAASEAARKLWISRLMDTSRRNNLLYFRDLKIGTLDLSSAEEGAIKRLFDGDKIPLKQLVPPAIDAKPGIKLREITRKARSNLEERGLQTLFVAFGMATWKVEDEGRQPEAAVVLLPVTAEVRRVDSEAMVVQRNGEPQANIALLHVLAHDFGVKITEEELIEAGGQEGEDFDPLKVLEFLRERTQHVAEMAIEPRAVVGNFSFQKLALVNELREEADEIAGHDMLAALAGDHEARTILRDRHANRRIVALDDVPAAQEFMVLDADSSQQVAVHKVANELDGVIQGPPGCGKSQTIANIISTLIAQGKRVLFVAEKRAALEAVSKRLDAVGLGHLTLDIHGATLSQKAVLAQIATAMDQIKRTPDPADDELHRRFEERRTRMLQHAATMHVPMEPSGLSAFNLQARILENGAFGGSSTRWRNDDLKAITMDVVLRVEDLLTESAEQADLMDRSHPSAWTSADLTDPRQVHAALDAVQPLAETDLPRLLPLLTDMTSGTGFRVPRTLADAEVAVKTLEDTNQLLANWDPAIFLDQTALSDLAAAERGAISSVWASLTNAKFKATRNRIAALSKTGVRSPEQLRQALLLARSVVQRWNDAGSTTAQPHQTPNIAQLRSALDPVLANVQRLDAPLPALRNLPFPELASTARRLAADPVTAHRIPTVRGIESELEALGVGAILIEFRNQGLPPGHWVATFRHAYYSSCYDEARNILAGLPGFVGEIHGRYAEEFCALDKERLKIAAARVRREHAEHAIRKMNLSPVQTQLIRTETAKRSRHLPFRKLVGLAPDVMTAVVPCWMSSPLNIGQLLPAKRRYFDVVVFDEASQVLPEDAVYPILRGHRLVVAGDRHQLPPTAFFADGNYDPDDDSPTAGFESLLDQMSAFLENWPLEWHYRSRDERLIAFSNHFIYEDSLTTFPGIGGPPAVSHVLVQGPMGEENIESAAGEINEVVKEIIAHAEAQILRPESDWESLGVIAMGIKHANRVEAALDKALDGRRDLDAYFATERDERFFVKNLEQVQGDERDAIILTIGYGKDRDGRLPYRFGPLNQQGGERRLNVAISRAKRRMTVVSSFSHRDMDPERSTNKGVELLRGFLAYAASEGTQFAEEAPREEPLNGLEADIRDALVEAGIPFVQKHGASGYRLDFALRHPEREDTFVLALETDGDGYWSAPTARDRDRLRRQQLLSIGWRFHRIWSTDWFLRRDEEVAKLKMAWEAAVRRADEHAHDIEAPPILAEPAGEPESARGPMPEFRDIRDAAILVQWILSDGLLKTDDEIIDELLPILGYRRRGPRIVQQITEAIAKVKG